MRVGSFSSIVVKVASSADSARDEEAILKVSKSYVGNVCSINNA